MRFFIFLAGIVGAVLLYNAYIGPIDNREAWRQADTTQAIHISLSDDGRMFDVLTKSKTVEEFLKEQNISVSEGDEIFPYLDQSLYSGSTVLIQRRKKIELSAEGISHTITTYQTEIERMLSENNIILNEDDFILPKDSGVVIDGDAISVVRVKIENVIVDKAIAYEEKEEEDDDLSWRKRIVKQKGEVGIRQFTYKVSYYDDKEVNRKLINQEVVKEPIMEIVTQGTHVEVGKSHTGLGTWYAFTGTMAAASPWLPMGSYVRVTNQDNGKQVIVKINDRGPFGKNRIIDLDKVAFAEIASLGAGIINVKVEEITN